MNREALAAAIAAAVSAFLLTDKGREVVSTALAKVPELADAPMKAVREYATPRPSAEDVDILARTIWGEARGEPYDGKVAVANVVMNRVRDPRWPDTVAEVCQQRLQFSAWNRSDPNRLRMLAVTPADPIFATCIRIAEKAVAGDLPDLTNGANHYEALETDPAWASRMFKVADIGRHEFWRA